MTPSYYNVMVYFSVFIPSDSKSGWREVSKARQSAILRQKDDEKSEEYFRSSEEFWSGQEAENGYEVCQKIAGHEEG